MRITNKYTNLLGNFLVRVGVKLIFKDNLDNLLVKFETLNKYTTEVEKALAHYEKLTGQENLSVNEMMNQLRDPKENT